MKVVSRLDDIMREQNLSVEALRQRLGVPIDDRTISKICRGHANWRLSREQLFALLALADEVGYELFEVRPNELWDTFVGSTAHIFRCREREDAHVEAHFSRLFERVNCRTQLHLDDADATLIRDHIDKNNCVFIGAPIASKASETALAHLCQVEAFSPEHHRRSPVAFIGRRPDGEWRSTFLRDESSHAVKIPGKRVAVTWYERDRFRTATGQGTDAALVVARRHSRGDKPVTTVVVAGYRAEGTAEAARALTHGEPPFSAESLADSATKLALFTYQFKKRPARRADARNLVQPEKGTGRWTGVVTRPWRTLEAP